MNRLVLIRFGILLALSFVGQPALAQAMQDYQYQPNRIYEIRTGLGITTQIELDPNDEVKDYSTGFSSGWELNRRDNVFYLKPKNVDVDTNMMVRTAKRAYIFELKVVATDWQALDQAKRAGVQYKVNFVYPKDEAFPEATGQAAGYPGQSTKLEAGRSYNFNYSFATRSRAPWMVPVSVYDDGRFTYVEMPDLTQFPTGNFPAVYGREKRRGEDFVVNTTVEKNTIVVHGTYNYLVIRHGENAVGLRRNPQQ
jgi:type IV secretion system protein VirB9